MKSKLLYSVLIFMSTFILFAQEEPFICGTVEDPNLPSPTYFSPLNSSAFSGSVDPEYLASFEPISFNIYFWIINPEDENVSYTPVTYQHIKENLIRVNELFKPMGICFVLKGYNIIESDAIYEGAGIGQINSYANANGYVSPNSFNVYITESLSAGNGVTNFGSNRLAVKRSHFIGFWELSPGNVLAHELAHDFYLMHPWGSANGTIITQEHVIRDPNHPDYNALSKGDLIHDTPAMVSFWNEANHFNLTIFDIIDVNSCNYTGSLTDALGVPFELTSTDVGNVMGYTWQPCMTTGFTTGQGIRIREWIANPPSNNNTQSLLAMRNDNPNIDLYIKDSPEDFGEEPNTASPYTWSSSDIWVRKLNDEQEGHQNPEYHPTNPNYVHIKIRNRGCSASTGNDTLKLYWSKAATSLSWDYHWNEDNTFDNNAPVGGEIGAITIPPIEPNKDITLIIPWNTPSPAQYSGINDEPWHFCLLARIISDDDLMAFPETSILGHNVRNNNNIAQKNVTIVDLEPNTVGKPIGGVIAVGNIFNEPRKYSLELVADNREAGKKIFEEAEVSINLDPVLLEAWAKGGKRGTNVRLRGENKLIVTGDNAKLENIDFDSRKTGTLNLTFNFLTKEITDKEEYNYHVIQKDDLTGMTIGGETYEIRKYPRGLFYANAEDKLADKNTPITLNAQTINEPAVYNWYDNEGNLIYEGADFTISVEVGEKYKLEVIALSDGYKDYTEVEVKLKPNSITTLYPNPTSNLATVAYKINQGNSAYLSVNALYGSNNISHNYILNVEENEITLDVSSYPQGLYSIVLVTNGQVSDTTTLIKQ